MPAQILMAISAAIVLLLGLLHLAFTYSGNSFHPRNTDLLAQLMATPPVISRQTTMWKAWIGFNASHSAGAIFFGAIFGYMAVEQPMLLFQSNFLGATGFIMLLAYLAMAKAYWFSRPLQGISLALLFYVAAFGIARIAALA